MSTARVQMWWDENNGAVGEVMYFYLMLMFTLVVWVYTMRLP